MTTGASTVQQLQFMESQAAHIESYVRMIQHGSIQHPELVGISREANPHADSVVYYSYDGTGEMVDLANRGNDIPLVQTQEEQHTVRIEWKALAYDWSDRELGRAMLVGTSLSDRKIRLAFRIAEEEKERVVLMGDSAKGWDGLINQPATRITPMPSGGAWSSATDATIFDELNALMSGGWEGTNQVRIADTLLLPVAQFRLLHRPMGNDANRSIMDYFMKNNVYTTTTGRAPMVRTVRQLEAAAANATDDRAMAYPRDMEVLRFHVPQELMFSEPQREGLGWIYYGAMVLAGLEVMEPTAIDYLDGI